MLKLDSCTHTVRIVMWDNTFCLKFSFAYKISNQFSVFVVVVKTPTHKFSNGFMFVLCDYKLNPKKFLDKHNI